MRDVTWIVLDDLKTNLIAALIVLVLAASFTKAIELPLKLSEVEKQTEGGEITIKATGILVLKSMRMHIGL